MTRRHGPRGASRRRGLWLVAALTTSVARADDVTFVTARGDEAPARAASSVERRDLDERLPRSAPDALRFEPGVFVQQTAHGQGSAFVRGRTGQQTVLLFDGIRLSNSLYRQGPNQYFFTVDTQTVQRIDVTRGGASTRHGSDALGGVLDARPVEPELDPDAATLVRPRTTLRYGSADRSFGERFQLDAQLSRETRVLAGIGYRRVSRLRGGGAVRSPVDGSRPQVPALEDDGVTQLGTEFGELTFDARLVRELGPRARATFAVYGYRQVDAPRTDQCPPPFAPRSECLTYDEQFRTLAYAALDASLGPLAEQAWLALSVQRNHEKRTRERPASFVENLSRDDVDTLGLAARATTARARVGASGWAALTYGGDVYHDRVASRAYTSFTDVGVVLPQSRGQVLDGSRYTTGGAFVDAEVSPTRGVGVQLGARGGAAIARAPRDPESGTAGVRRTFPLVAGHAGAWVAVAPRVKLLLGVDRSVRAPNLDDLTSRQQAGPGFQFENAALAPERGTTAEVGARVAAPRLDAELWVFRAWTSDAITRIDRGAADCPPGTPECAASWSRYQLVNGDGLAILQGVEASLRARLPARVTVRASASFTTGDAPNLSSRAATSATPHPPRVPLSRVPPPNGTAEVRWGLAQGAHVGAALRWAAQQRRLAPSDLSDARIPLGGTPGFAVWDLRAGLRVRRELVTSIVVENLLDSAYRYHGSAVNGPGRGVLLSLEAGL